MLPQVEGEERIRVESLVSSMPCTHFLASMTFFLFLGIHAGSSSRPSEFCAIDQYSVSSDGSCRFGLTRNMATCSVQLIVVTSSESVEVVNRPVVVRQPTAAGSVVEQTSRRNHIPPSGSSTHVLYIIDRERSFGETTRRMGIFREFPIVFNLYKKYSQLSSISEIASIRIFLVIRKQTPNPPLR